MNYKTLFLISSLIITNSTLALSPGLNIGKSEPDNLIDFLEDERINLTYVLPILTFKYDNGNLAKSVPYSRAADKVDGIVETYYETGELFEELKFNDGRLVEISVYKKNGDQSLYYEVPGKEEYTFECPDYGPNLQITCHPDGVAPGYTKFNKDGSSSGIDRYYGNVLRARIYYKNGNLMKLVPYSGGVVHRIVETYYETGGLFEKWEFDYGKPVAMIVYKKDGTVSIKVGEIEEIKPVEYDDEKFDEFKDKIKFKW